MHDRGVQPGLDALVQEHRVEHHARGRVEPEGDVGDAQHGLHVGVAPLQLADGLHGLQGVAVGLLLAGGDGEGQAVDEDVGLADAVLAGELGDDPLGDLDLLGRGARLPLLVDGQRDQGGAVLGGQRGDPGEAGVGAVAVLVVDGVEDRASADHLQPGLQYGDLGGVEHQGQGGGGGQPGGQLPHVAHPVAADVVDAQVEHVRAVADLVAGDLDAVVVAFVEHGLAERLGAVGVGAFADGQVAGVLPERHALVDGGRRGLGERPAFDDAAAPHPLDHLPEVLGRGAAAAAHQGQAELADEGVVGVGQLVRPQRVDGPVRAQLGQARVGHAGDRDPGVVGEVAQVLAHLGRSGGAVQADRVDAQRLQGGERGADLGAHQHRAGGLDGDLDDDRGVGSRGAAGAPRADHGGLGLQQVLAGLDEDRVGPAVDEPARALLVVVAQQGVGGVPERGQLRAGTDRPEDVAGLVGRAVGVGGLAGQPRPGLGELVGAVGDAVLAEVAEVRAEGVGLHAVDAHPQVRLVDRPHHVGSGDVEDLVASLMALEVVQAQVVRLEHGAHPPVGDDDAGTEGLTEGESSAHRPLTSS